MTETYLVSRNVVVLGKRTSMRLEPKMWEALTEISNYERCSIGQICSYIALQKSSNAPLTAATRVFLMLYYKKAVTQESREKFHGYLRNAIRETNNDYNNALRNVALRGNQS